MHGGAAMMTYNIEPDQAQLKEAKELFEFLGGNSTDATRIAVNKSARRMRLVARKEIRKDVRLDLSYVSERLVVKAARKGELSAKISTPSRGLRLTKFSTDANIAAEGVAWFKPPLSAVRQKGGDTPPFMVQVKPGGATKPVRGDTSKSKPFVIVGKGSRADDDAIERLEKIVHGMPQFTAEEQKLVRDVLEAYRGWQVLGRAMKLLVMFLAGVSALVVAGGHIKDVLKAWLT